MYLVKQKKRNRYKIIIAQKISIERYNKKNSQNITL